MIARRLLVTATALLLAIAVVRSAVVANFAPIDPAIAARWWPDHPDVVIARGMIRIASLARSGKPVDQATLAAIYRAAPLAPLAVEPFLVRGVQAQIEGDEQAAKDAFTAAQRRDPRSLPAAYFLAEHYFKLSDAEHGLEETAAVSRLSPNGKATVAPYLAAYAQNPANWPALRRIFRSNPELQEAALVELAQRAQNAPAVLALADARNPGSASRWLPALVNSLNAAGQYSRARAIWAKVSGVQLPPGALLYDSGFRDTRASPPFNWSLNSSTVGLAERQPGGRLHVLFYGQQDGVLARQLLVLAPGAYRLDMRLLGDPSNASALSWGVRCDKGAEPFASATLDAARNGLDFRVSANCPAQWLELSGRSADIPQPSDLTVSNLRISRATPRA